MSNPCKTRKLKLCLNKNKSKHKRERGGGGCYKFDLSIENKKKENKGILVSDESLLMIPYLVPGAEEYEPRC